MAAVVVDVSVPGTRAGRVSPPLTRLVTLGGGAGALSGLLVAGVLSRLAMRVLAATSPGARGLRTDDDATVGVISVGGSVTLVLITAGLGAFSGWVYLLVRRFLPPSARARTGLAALGGGAVGGALLVHDDASFDYSVLEPQALAVAMFVAIPALSFAATAALVEAWVRRDARTGRVAWWQALAAVGAAFVALVGLAIFGVPGLVLAALLVLALVLARVPAVRRAWGSRAVTVAGVVLLSALVLWGLYGLVADVVSIVTDTPSTAPFTA